ncbi:MAG: tRNA (adenosine(37)-N6)-dimethylallyltransferase MiaA [Cyanobacteriota bacterium]|nr:tRNA (adenosine(37)-N6)-dimethylallyltransferase MiaA [Cyanobacteriota bacterium]
MTGLIVVCGPTATGKSDQALRLAQKLASPIIGADSRQIYRDFNIGTAKPSPQQLAAWPHYLIDWVDPRETVTLAEYQREASRIIQATQAQGRIPIVVGGTGLYIQSITAGLQIPAVPPQPDLRAQLQSLPQSLCYAYLQQVDPQAANRIHPHDGVRTLRSLEVYYTTGQPLSRLQGWQPPDYPILWLGLTSAKPDLDKRIRQRVAAMMEQGWIEEVMELQARYGRDLPLLQTLGYGEIGQYLAGGIPQRDLEPLIGQHTRQLAKRQLTWFRRVPAIHWFDCQDPHLEEQMTARVEQFFDQQGWSMSNDPNKG